ncbi:MAG: hypothetical protein ACT4RN_09845 [Pseudonocardia sp.]
MDVEAAWVSHVVAELVAHVADSLTPRLPGDLRVLGIGPDLALTGSPGDRRLATWAVPEPAEPADAGLPALAAAMLTHARDVVEAPWAVPGPRPLTAAPCTHGPTRQADGSGCATWPTRRRPWSCPTSGCRT